MIKKNHIKKEVITKDQKTVIDEIKILNKHLDKIQYLIYEYISKDWTDEKKQKVLSELAWWGLNK